MGKEFVCLSSEQINDILKFIESNFSYNFCKENQIENAIKLSKFLKSKKYIISESDAQTLLDKSFRLNSLFSCLLKLDCFSKILNLDNISLLADMYCLRENIIYDIEKEENSKDLNLFFIYLNDISQYDILSSEEERELGFRIIDGDIEARNQLILHNLRFVVFLANKFTEFSGSFFDLIQFGNEGLILAAERFDPNKGVRFASYASYYIKQYMYLGFLNTNRTVKLPVFLQKEYFSVKKEIINYLIKNDGVYPSDLELAKILQISTDRVKLLKESNQSILSLSDAVYKSDGTFFYIDTIEDTSPSLDEQMNKEYLIKLVNRLKSNLSNRDREIIELFFGFNGEPMTLETIASMYGLSKERIRQIKNYSLARMKSIYDVISNYDRDSFKTYL